MVLALMSTESFGSILPGRRDDRLETAPLDRLHLHLRAGGPFEREVDVHQGATDRQDRDDESGFTSTGQRLNLLSGT